MWFSLVIFEFKEKGLSLLTHLDNYCVNTLLWLTHSLDKDIGCDPIPHSTMLRHAKVIRRILEVKWRKSGNKADF